MKNECVLLAVFLVSCFRVQSCCNSIAYSYHKMSEKATTSPEKLPEPIIPLDSSDFQNVYEPAEDSYLFMDALEKDLPFLQKLDPSIVLELG